jgi:transmembrane sensor
MQKKEKAEFNLIQYLTGEENSDGEILFNRWFRKKTREPEDDNLWKNENSDEVGSRIRAGIFDAIEKESNPVKKRLPNPKTYRRRSFNRAKRFALMAASVALLIIGSIMVSQLGNPYPKFISEIFNLKKELDYTTIASPFGKKTIVNLTDGTKIMLNSGSEIRFLSDLSDGKRKVFLTGEAFFDVARDEHRPFVVHSGNLITTVLGTSFNIKANQSESEVLVTVATGKVKVELEKSTYGLNDQVEFLNPNDQMHYNAATGHFKKNQVETSSIAAWKENVLLFNDESLTEISNRLERWFNVEIRINDPDLKNLRFTGKFENPVLNTILEAISYSTNIDYDAKDRVIEWKSLE